ncbi:hypothetical protein ACKI1J_17515 [Streptomyces scabiei]|uniref:Alpha/beta hydrolase n=2 Tax=Streptomyces TaxID=1883 RepID=A0ABW9IWQ7_STRGJ|nr:hypothetical protein [Streptomyces sp. LBUM 1475]QTU60684.1 hypothetical protein F3K22_06475 [Streptomyces sp. LBUM 1475]
MVETRTGRRQPRLLVICLHGTGLCYHKPTPLDPQEPCFAAAPVPPCGQQTACSARNRTRISAWPGPNRS